MTGEDREVSEHALEDALNQMTDMDWAWWPLPSAFGLPG